jgi:transposase
MHLSDHSLLQIDDEYLHALEVEALRGLSSRLLADLKEARERLNQGPTNSSRPPSSRAPWERGVGTDAAGEPADEEPTVTEPKATKPAEPKAAEPAEPTAAEPKPARKAGKQPGAPGVGRTQVLEAHDTQPHRPETCAGGGRPFPTGTEMPVYTGFQEVDLRWGDTAAPGLQLWVVDHRYHEATCACGHHTRAVPGQGAVDPLLTGVELSEWRLVGPGLATLIVALSKRYRLSHRRIQEFLQDWLGVTLSTGTVHRTVQEAGAAIAPAEEELVAAVQGSGLLYSDETSWPEQGRSGSGWLWVFTAATVTLYYIAGRGRELLDNLLEGFTGWLMTDGWGAYRHYPRRLRCWAHLLRKAQGLADSYHRDARAFGHQVRDLFHTLMEAVYAAREGPPADLPTHYADSLADLRAACERFQHHDPAKTRALAVELLNDWDAIFRVLAHPELPLTNNEAERALRHWVIVRKLSYGTRTDTGSRVFTLLASVIDTCRQRGHSPWPYLRTAIADRRAGRPLAPLPQ